jgi:hypothetical protein
VECIDRGFWYPYTRKRKKKQVKSKWDTLHPGRSLAKGLPNNPMSERKILGLIADFFAGKKVPILTPAEAVFDEEEGAESEEK